MSIRVMRFKYDESLFIKSRMHPVKVVSLPFDKYGFKLKMAEGVKQQGYIMDVFNPDEYREREIKEEVEALTEIE